MSYNIRIYFSVSQMTHVIGITGRSCSGKSTLAQNVVRALQPNAIHIDIDDFFRYAADFNCENPGDTEYVAMNDVKQQLEKLKLGKSANFTHYDFKNKRKLHNSMVRFEPKEYVIVEGALVFWEKNIRDLFGLKVFVDVPDEVCRMRRLSRALDPLKEGSDQYIEMKRYVLERWRSIRNQWDKCLQDLIEFADIIIPHPLDGTNELIEAIGKI